MWCWSGVAHAAPSGVERERERGRWNRACSLGLFSHPLMKRTASPPGLLEFLALGRMRDICPSVTLQHANSPTLTHSLAFSLSLFVSVTQTCACSQLHTLHFDLQANSDKLIRQVNWTETKDGSNFFLDLAVMFGSYDNTLVVKVITDIWERGNNKQSDRVRKKLSGDDQPRA